MDSDTLLSTFKTADYVVLVGTLLVSAAIGIYFRFTGGRQRTTEEYLLGDRNQSVIPVAISLMTSFLSAVAILGTTAEMYMFGTQYLIVNLGYLICTPIAAYLYLPVFFKLGTTTAYEYLEMRFGAITRTTASLLYSVQVLIYTGVVLYTPAMALVVLTGLSVEKSILLVGIVCIFYSTIGGMKAVIVTDVFQACLMFAAVICVIVAGIFMVGGISSVWDTAVMRERIEILNFNPDPTVRHTFWSLTIGGGMIFLSQFAVNQTQVQRYMTMKDLQSSVKALWLSTPIVVVFYLITGFAGLTLFAVYEDCDPLTSGRISRRDQLTPLFVMESLQDYPGLAGLFVAGIFSAALSHVSATTNSLAAVTLEDYIKPLYRKMSRKPFPEEKGTLLTKVFALSYGIFCLLIAFLARYVDGILQAAISIIGVVCGPLLGTFTLGMFIPSTNQPGVLVGLISGLCSSTWISMGGPKPTPPHLSLSTSGCNHNISTLISTLNFDDHTVSSTDGDDNFFYLYRLSYMWYIVIGFAVTIIVGTFSSSVASICADVQSLDDPNLFSPPIAHILHMRKQKFVESDTSGRVIKENINNKPDGAAEDHLQQTRF